MKDIAAAHKAPGAALATETVTIDGQSMEAFANVPRNLGELYALGLQTPQRDFLVYQEERYSFAETLEMAHRLARVLRETYGIGKGDRVAVCGRNSPEWCLTYMASTLIGAIIVPMNSLWKGPELEYGLRDSGSKLVVADAQRLRLLEPHLESLGIPVVVMKPEAEAKSKPGSESESESESEPEAGSGSEAKYKSGEHCAYPEFYSLLEGVVALDEDSIAACAVVPEDDATIMYTSGSTGHPKGVLSTHRGIINALYTWKFVKEINEILRPELVEENPPYEPAILCNVPLFHVTGSHAQFLASFIYQRKMVMMYKWDADKALALIEQERISILHGVPTMAWEVMHSPHFERADISSLRNVQGGGAPRPPEHLQLITRKFPAIVQPGLGYGLTETNAIGAIISGKFYQARPASTGRPTPPVLAMKIVDEGGNKLEAEEIGEICIKGPTVMRGYWNQPAATADVIKDGWFYTGDIGKLDALGFLIILDRAKDIVIRGGENIACAEVEYAIAEHPLVNEVSAYGIPDRRLGEILCASVVLKPETRLDAASLKEFLAERIANFKIPARLFFGYEQLPRVASGKTAKKQLRQETIERLASEIPSDKN